MVLDSKKWDSDRWDGWEIILGSIPPFFRDIWSNKTSQTSFVAVIFSIFRLLFSQYWRQVPIPLSFRKKNSGTTTAGTASKIQYLNIIQIFKIPKNIVKNDQLVFKPWLLAEIWVSKNPGFVHGFPRISHPMDFPPHGFWIFGEAAGAADKNQDWTPRPNLQAA